MNIEINTDFTVISPYSIMIVLSFISGILVQYYLNVNRGISKKTSCKLILFSPVMSVICGILLTYYSSGRQYFGLSSIGGLIGMYISVLLLALIEHRHGELSIMMQNCTFALPLMYSVSKIGCLLSGCCHGIEYDGFFSIDYISSKSDTITVFPVQLWETVSFFAIFVIGMILYKRHSRYSVWVTFMLSASAKFVLDFFRESHQYEIISLNQVLCIILVVVGITVIMCNPVSHLLSKQD